MAVRQAAPVIPGCPPTTSTAPELYFVSRAPRRGTTSRSAGVARDDLGRRSPRARCRRRRRHPAWNRPGPTARPTFGRVEGHREISVDDGTGDLARRRVDTRWQIDRDDRSGRRVDPLDDRGRLGPRFALKARSEERVDHDVVVVEPLVDLVRDVPRLAEHARRNAPVAAVRATAADAREPCRAPGTRASPRARRRCPRAPSARGWCPGSPG